MKLKLVDDVPTQVADLADFLRSQKQRHPLSFYLFLALCFNLVLAPAVLAASDGGITRLNAYAIGILGLVTVGLGIYLLAVMLQPQRF